MNWILKKLKRNWIGILSIALVLTLFLGGEFNKKHSIDTSLFKHIGYQEQKNSSNELHNDSIQISDEYLNWLNLSDEEKKNTVKPKTYKIDYEPNNITPFKRGIVGFNYDSDVFPSTYNLVDKSCTTPVKNQRNWNYCWAFAGTTMLESHQLNKRRDTYTQNCNTAITYEYNPMHIGYELAYKFSDDVVNIYGNKELNAGGNNIDTLLYLASGMGPVNSVNFSITSEDGNFLLPGSVVRRKVSNLMLKNMHMFNGLNLDEHGPDSTQFNEYVKSIKKAIIENGAVSFASAAPVNGASYYNSTTFSVKTNNLYEGISYPHMMTIVGWDDNYDKNNFAIDHIPQNNGAWIIQNSWGTGNGVNGEGYFYYSYEDYGLNSNDMATVKETSGIDYDNLYQYNPSGDIFAYSGKYAVNVFEKNVGESESIKEIGIFNFNKNSTYKIYINPNYESLDLEDFTLVKEFTDTNDFSEYKVITLDESVEITGDKFAIMMEVTNSNSDFNIPIQNKATKYATHEEVGIRLNQGFVSIDGTNWEDTSLIMNDNIIGFSVLMKAYSQINSENEEVTVSSTLSSNSIKLGSAIKGFLITSNVKNIPIDDVDFLIKTVTDNPETNNIDVTNLFTLKTSQGGDNIFYTQLMTKIDTRNQIIDYNSLKVEITAGEKVVNLPFTIEQINVTSMEAPNDIYLNINDTIDLKTIANIQPLGADVNISFISTNLNIFGPESNYSSIFVAKKLGEATLILSTTDGTNFTKMVKIHIINPEGILEGSGTELDPYLINNKSDFKYIYSGNGKYYKLTTDLDFSEETSEGGIYYNEGKGFEPIGIKKYTHAVDGIVQSIKKYTIKLNGNNHKITGIKINRPNENYVGLFYYLYNSEIKNLRLEDSEIIAHENVSSLASIIENSIIDSYVNKANITGNSWVGGITYNDESSTFLNTSNWGNVTALSVPEIQGESTIYQGNAGGFSVRSDNSTFDSCFNIGNITTSNENSVNAAGIVVYAFNITITNTYNAGNVYSALGVSGIVKESKGKIIINNSYNVGKISGRDMAGIVLWITNNSERCTISNTYDLKNDMRDIYDLNNYIPFYKYLLDSNNIDIIESEERYIEDLKDYTKYSNSYDFENIWFPNDNNLPTLRNNPFIFTSSINIEQEEIVLKMEDTETLNVLVGSEEASIKSFKYEIGTPGVISIDQNNLITPIKQGETKIIVSTNDGTYLTDEINISVVSDLYGELLGKGTISDPYQITSPEELNMIRLDKFSSYKLMNDLDMSSLTSEGGAYYNEGLGWEPIGYYNYTWDPSTQTTIIDDKSFHGNFDGNYKTISGLNIKGREQSSLFGVIKGIQDYENNIYKESIIKNLKIKEAQISSNSSSAALTNTANFVNFDNIGINGNITSDYSASGIVNDGYNVSINNSYVSGNITGKFNAGGLSYSLNNSDITNSYNTASLYGRIVGGLASTASNTTFNNIYNTGDINAPDIDPRRESNIPKNQRMGEIIGEAREITIDNTYYLTGINYIGKLNTYTCSNYNYECDEQYRVPSTNNIGENIYSINFDDFKTESNLSSLDFEDVWEIKENNPLPTLKSNPYIFVSEISSNTSTLNLISEMTNTTINVSVLPENATYKELTYKIEDPSIASINNNIVSGTKAGTTKLIITSTDGSKVKKEIPINVESAVATELEGSGTIEDPYQITTPEELNMIRYDRYASYKLINDLDMSSSTSEGGTYYNNGLGWEPIGYYNYTWDSSTQTTTTDDKSFYGNFDGNNKVISGLYINRPNDSASLFGEIKGTESSVSQIKNLSLINSRIYGKTAAALATNITKATISNIGINATITAKENAGGLASYINDSTLNKVYNEGNISSELAGEMFSISVGGISSGISETSITDSYNVGEVTGIENVGGIVGNVGYNGRIINSFNTGNITGNIVGGIVGSGYNSEIKNVYNIGIINNVPITSFGNSYKGSIIGESTILNINNVYYEESTYWYGKSYEYYCTNYSDTCEEEYREYYENIIGENISDKSLNNLKNQSELTYFNFDDTWEMKNENVFPTLKVLPYRYISDFEIDDITISMNQSFMIIPSFTPNYVDNPKLKFVSNDTSIVTLSESENGLVTSVSPGTTSINATTTDGTNITKQIDVTVITDVKSVSLNESTKTLTKNNIFNLVATILPSNATNQDVTWSSSDSSIASVNNGVVTAHKKGIVTITVTTANGNKTASCVFTIEDLQLKESDNYTINGRDVFINSKLSKNQLLSQLSSNGNNINFSNNNNYIGTGTIITINGDGNIKEFYTVVVKGDLTGTGESTVADVAKLYQMLKGKITVENHFKKAGDLISDEDIKINDVAKLYQYIKGKINSL